MQNREKVNPRFDFNVGDTVIVSSLIAEGEKTRTQKFEGVVIAQKGTGITRTFMVRRVGTDEIGIERIFPEFSPLVENVEVKRKGAPRRSKLYFLRDRKGRRATYVKASKE